MQVPESRAFDLFPMSFLGNLKARILTAGSPFWRIYLRLRGIEVGAEFTCIGRPGINRKRDSSIRIGNYVTLCNSGIANPVAEYGLCRLATVASGARLVIKDHVGMSSVLICCAVHVEIGEGTQIGGGAMILDTDFHPRAADGTWLTDPKAVSSPVRIGRKCFIGARAIILKGVTIGDGSIVGAGAVVTRNIPAGATVAGNPARIVKLPSF
jgi:acetyltransferase-like isoleucine patch superfamily enzyme